MPKTEMEPAVRERLEEAMLRELGERGREGLSVETALGEAGVSAEEFLAEYGDVDACVDGAYERLTIQLDAAMRVACATGGAVLALTEPGWTTRVRAGLEATLAELADRPAIAKALTRAYPSLGPSQQARYQAFVERFAGQLRVRREMGGVDGELPESVDSLAVGAAEAIIFEEIVSGRAEQLPAMGPSILFSVLVPFLGASGASEEMQKAQQPRK
jgi:AcrR family transcriptional regulator